MNGRIAAAWAWWRDLWAGTEPPHILAILRILVSAVLLSDLYQVWRLHLIVPLWGPGDPGGFGNPDHQENVIELYRWFPADAHTARHAFAVLVVSLICVMVGWLAQPACLVAVLVYAQFAQVLPEADRGIDMMLRNVLLLLAFVPTGRFWGLDARIFGPLDRVPAWPRRLLILQIAAMYFLAGIQKTAVAWWPWGGYSALFIVLQDPAVARFPFQWLRPYYPITQLASAVTMAFECVAFLVPLVYLYRATRTKSGWLRAQFNRLDILRWWLPFGVALHLGIAATMQIGIFPWAMLGLYPAFFHPDELLRGVRRLDRYFGLSAR